MVCSNLDELELIVNGKSAGKQAADKYEMNSWTVAYAPGWIEAIGYRAGEAIAKTRVETAGAPVALKITADRDTVLGNGMDALPFTIEAVDSRGRHVPVAQNGLTFTVTGGDIIGLGNGNPNDLAAEKGDRRALFNGLAQVIVQTRASATGTLTLTARAEGLKSATAKVKVARAPVPARQTVSTSSQDLDYWYCAPEADTREDALKNMKVDMKLWDDFGPRWLHDPQDKDGYTLVSAHYTPFARVQKEGGTIDFPSITGAVEVYDGEILIGSKTDRAEGVLSVDLPPGQGERRLNLLFKTDAGEAFAFKKMVFVRQKEMQT